MIRLPYVLNSLSSSTFPNACRANADTSWDTQYVDYGQLAPLERCLIAQYCRIPLRMEYEAKYKGHDSKFFVEFEEDI